MPEQLLTVLKLCLLALLYLFFLRVLRAVWSEVSPPRAAAVEAVAPSTAPVAPPPKVRTQRASKRAAVPTKLVVVEPQGLAEASYLLEDDITIGRAPGCAIVFDQQYVSQVHTRVFRRENQVFVEDLGSTNGTWVNGTRATGQMPARAGDRIQIGNVVLELR